MYFAILSAKTGCTVPVGRCDCHGFTAGCARNAAVIEPFRFQPCFDHEPTRPIPVFRQKVRPGAENRAVSIGRFPRHGGIGAGDDDPVTSLFLGLV